MIEVHVEERLNSFLHFRFVQGKHFRGNNFREPRQGIVVTNRYPLRTRDLARHQRRHRLQNLADEGGDAGDRFIVQSIVDLGNVLFIQIEFYVVGQGAGSRLDV